MWSWIYGVSINKLKHIFSVKMLAPGFNSAFTRQRSLYFIFLSLFSPEFHCFIFEWGFSLIWRDVYVCVHRSSSNLPLIQLIFVAVSLCSLFCLLIGKFHLTLGPKQQKRMKLKLNYQRCFEIVSRKSSICEWKRKIEGVRRKNHETAAKSRNVDIRLSFSRKNKKKYSDREQKINVTTTVVIN